MRAIAQGGTRLNEIMQASGVGTVNTVARSLDNLQQMRLATRSVPATESQREKSKKGMYQIDDHFLRFRFRYIQPNQAGLDLGLADAILEQRVRPDLDHFVAIAYKEASRAYCGWLARSGRLAFMPERIGSWWNRENEIDVLAMGQIEKATQVGECKWSINPVGINVLEDLKIKAQILVREKGLDQIYFALFSRSGFTIAMEEQPAAKRVELVTVEQIVQGR